VGLALLLAPDRGFAVASVNYGVAAYGRDDVLIQVASQLEQLRPGLAGVRKVHPDRPAGP
jgi:hypothetical protein